MLRRFVRVVDIIAVGIVLLAVLPTMLGGQDPQTTLIIGGVLAFLLSGAAHALLYIVQG